MSQATVFFHGSIPEAIGVAQRSSKLFLVYIADDGEESRKLEDTWISSEVVEIVRENVVALRLIHGSPAVSHFSALYPCSGVPCITIIGYEGVKIWQHVGYVSSEQLAASLRQAMGMFRSQLQQAAARTMATILGMQAAALPRSNVAGTAPPVTASGDIQGRHDDGASTSTTEEKSLDTVMQEAETPSAVEPSAEGEHGLQHEASSSGEGESTSKEAATMSVSSPGDSLKTSASSDSEQTSRALSSVNEVAEGDIQGTQASGALSSVNEVAEGDIQGTQASEVAEEIRPTPSPTPMVTENEVKADESAKRVDQDVQEAKKVLPSRKPRVEVKKPEPKPVKIPEKISLQVKLTDGTLIREEFEKHDDLWTVKSYVDANRTDGGGNYSFAVPFPRKVFTAEEYETPLIDLGIGYRAALILVPTKDNKPMTRRSAPSSPTAQSGGGGSSVGRWLSFLNPLSYVRASEGPKSPPSSPTAASSSSDTGEGKSSKLTKRRSWGANIHTLKHDEEDMFKKGNAYWNGNSTEFGSNDDKDK